MSSDENLAFLRSKYGVITEYLRGKYGVNHKVFEEDNNERGLFILLLIDLFSKITKEEMAKILDCSLSTIEKSMQKTKKTIPIHRKGSDKTGKWQIQKKNYEK